MAAAAAGGLTFALLTVHTRREHDYQAQPTVPAPPVVRTVPPAELGGLGYLPARTNLVAAVHVAEAMRTPAGRAFLDRAELAGTGFHLADIERDIGISRDDIDHIVFGVRLLDKQIQPRLALIVQTRQPYDAGRLRAGLKAGRREKIGQKEIYHFNLEKPALSAVLWCAAANTLVVGISRDDLAALPNNRAANLEQLPDALQQFIRQHLKPGTQAWLAGHVDDWEPVLPFTAALKVSDENRTLLAGLRTFGFWLRFDEQVEVRGAAQCADAAGATLLQKLLTRVLAKENKYLNVLGSTPEAEKVAEELTKSVKVLQNDTWVTLEATASGETVRKAIGN
jgi:hypothetical protein